MNVTGLNSKTVTVCRVLGLVCIALFFYFSSTSVQLHHDYVFVSDPPSLLDDVETTINTYELRSNGNLVVMNDNIEEQWNKFTITNVVDGTVMSDHYKVIQMIENLEAAGLYHDVCTILLGHPNSYNPYSDVLIELVVGVNHTKCNVVIVDKGDNPISIKFNDKIVATTDAVTQDGIYSVETRDPNVYGEWISFNFWK